MAFVNHVCFYPVQASYSQCKPGQRLKRLVLNLWEANPVLPTGERLFPHSFVSTFLQAHPRGSSDMLRIKIFRRKSIVIICSLIYWQNITTALILVISTLLFLWTAQLG